MIDTKYEWPLIIFSIISIAVVVFVMAAPEIETFLKRRREQRDREEEDWEIERRVRGE